MSKQLNGKAAELSWEEQKDQIVKLKIIGTGDKKVRYTLRFNHAASTSSSNTPDGVISPQGSGAKFQIYIEYGEFDYNYPIIENEKLKNFSREEAQAFCEADYKNYLENKEITWKLAREFEPILSSRCALVGFNSKNKARYEIHTIAPGPHMGEVKAELYYVAQKITRKFNRVKILNKQKGFIRKTILPLPIADCKALCQKDYEKSINNILANE